MTPVSVTLTAVDDAVVEGFHKSDVTLVASGAAPYAGKQALLVADVADNEVPGVLVLETDGSTNVVEVDSGVSVGSTAPWLDTYQVVLTKQPGVGEIVTVKVLAEPTRTSRLDIRSFTPQVGSATTTRASPRTASSPALSSSLSSRSTTTPGARRRPWSSARSTTRSWTAATRRSSRPVSTM